MTISQSPSTIIVAGALAELRAIDAEEVAALAAALVAGGAAEDEGEARALVGDALRATKEELAQEAAEAAKMARLAPLRDWSSGRAVAATQTLTDHTGTVGGAASSPARLPAARPICAVRGAVNGTE